MLSPVGYRPARVNNEKPIIYDGSSMFIDARMEDSIRVFYL